MLGEEGGTQRERCLMAVPLLASLDCWGSSSAPQSPRKDSKLLFLAFWLYFPLEMGGKRQRSQDHSILLLKHTYVNPCSRMP